MVRLPTYHYIRCSSITNIVCITKAFSINDVLEVGYRNGTVAKDKAFFLDFSFGVICEYLLFLNFYFSSWLAIPCINTSMSLFRDSLLDMGILSLMSIVLNNGKFALTFMRV